MFLKMILGLSLFFGLNIKEHITGLNVRATTVEINTETTIVMVNCLYNIPVIPDKKLTGTNTAASTNDVAMSGLTRVSIAFFVASYGDRCSCSIMRSTFSTTTMASSTTIPIASTNPNNVNMFKEKPNISMKPNVPIKEIGTATKGITVALQLCNERNTTRMTSINASNNVL